MQDIFTKGLKRWFALEGFQVGMPTKDMDRNFSVEDFQDRIENFTRYSEILGGAIGIAVRLLSKARWIGEFAERAGKWRGWVGTVGGVAGTAITVATLLVEIIESKTTAAEFYEALKPYESRSDYIGLKISGENPPSTFRAHPKNKTFWNTVLVPVIYADDLTPDSIMERFDKFLEASDSLKRLGLRAKFIGNRASIYPLLVYFDSKKLEEDKELLWPQIFEERDTEGLRPRTRSDKASRTPGFKATLSAGVVDVQKRWVCSEIFDEDDLYSVLERGQSGNEDTNK